MDTAVTEKRMETRAAITAFLLWAAVMVGTLYCYDFRFSWLINAGETYYHAETDSRNIHYIPKSDGYDGQFYYRLALNPFTTEKSADGVTLDRPALRQQRLVYPLAVWVGSIGGRLNVPLMMIVVNIAFIFGLCLASARLVSRLGYPPQWCACICLFPGLFYAVKMDLTEPSLAFFLVLYFLYIYENRVRAAAVALALAMLSRESAIIIAAGKAIELLIVVALKGEASKKRIFWTLFPFVPFAAWQGWLYRVWGEIPLLASGDANVGVPFSGFLKYVQWLLNSADAQSPVSFVHVAMILVVAGAAVVACVKRGKLCPPSYAIWMLAYLAVFFVMGNPWNGTFLRVFTGFYIAAAYIYLQVRPGVVGKLFPLATALWFVAAVYESMSYDFYVIWKYINAAGAG